LIDFNFIRRRLETVSNISNREVLIILRDHSAIFGRAPVIIEDKQIQFCSSDNKLPVVLPLEKIWTVGAAGV
jgi:hypothetical protein